jgi:chromosome segregation ATPase
MADHSQPASAGPRWGTVLTIGGLLILLSTITYSAHELRAYEDKVVELQTRLDAQALDSRPKVPMETPATETTATVEADVASGRASAKEIERLNAELTAARQEASNAQANADKCVADAGGLKQDLEREKADREADRRKVEETITQLRNELKKHQDRCIIVQ